MPLVLSTDTNPGEAQWVEAGTSATVDVVQTLGIDEAGANPLPIVALATTPATGTATVGAAPLAAGNTLTINGNALTGVAGARTPGSDDFDATVGTIAGMVQEIVQALNDPANSFELEIYAYATGTAGEIGIVAVDGLSSKNYTLASNTGNIVVSGANMTGGGTLQTTTIVFEAPASDILLKQLYIYASGDAVFDMERLLYLTSITIDGGANLVTGVVPMAVTGASTPATSPEMNLTVSAGQVVRIQVQNLAQQNLLVQPVWTAIPLPSTVPASKILLGGAAATTLNLGTGATGSITVANAANVLPGDTIVFRILNGSTYVLTGVGGARTSGSRDFDTTGAAGNITASITAAVNDAANGFSTVFTAVDSDPDVDLTMPAGVSGPDAWTVTVHSPSGGLTPASVVFAGGANGLTTFTFVAAPQDLVLERLYLQAILGGGSAAIQDILIVRSITIDGGANLLEGAVTASVLSAQWEEEGPLLDISVTTGQVVSIVVENPSSTTIGFLAAWTARSA